jgi:hypothetical protein
MADCRIVLGVSESRYPSHGGGLMNAQAKIGTDGGTESTDCILEELPPEKLLDTPNFRLIRGGVTCMHSIETVKQYVSHENVTEQREQVLRLLHQRAAELREQE